MNKDLHNIVCKNLTKQFINPYLNSITIEGNILYIKYNSRLNLEYCAFEKEAFKHKNFIKFTDENSVITMYFKIN